MSAIFLTGAVQAFMLFLLTIKKYGKSKKSGDRLLAAWMIYFCIHLLYPAFVYFQYPRFLAYSGMDGVAFIGHSLFFYFLYHTYLDSKPSKRERLVIVILTLLVSLSFSVSYFSMAPANRIKLLKGFIPFPALTYAGSIGLCLISFYILFLMNRRMKEFRRKIEDQYSQSVGIPLSWFRLVWLSIFIYTFAFLISLLFMPAAHLLPVWIDISFYTGLTLLLLFIAYTGLQEGTLFITPDFPLQDRKAVSETEPSRYIPDQKDLDEAEKLLNLLKNKRLYLNPELNLQTLSIASKLPSQRISFLFRQVLKSSFYKTVNEMRIASFKAGIARGDHLKITLLGLAQECGFNSKASFNRIFKQKTGLSPSEYIKKQQSGLNSDN